MANFVFNIAKGRVVELYHRVDNNDPTNSALVVVAINTSAADATLKDLDTLALVLANAGTSEVTNAGYARKVLDGLDAYAAVDDMNDYVDVSLSNQTWTSVAAGTGWTDLLICYDPDTTGGTDANIIPLTCNDFVVTPDGSDIIADLSTNGFYRAAE
jgi:hypothetical protein